ncbi:hypothetical protein X551_02079 [Methylibium sp. T29]|nr:hypothetical protein X551_02079 [Methylibium sp. T29]
MRRDLAQLHAPCAGNVAQIEPSGGAGAHVEDHGLCALIDQRLQFGLRDAGHRCGVAEAPPPQVAPQHEAGDGQQQQRGRRGASPGQHVEQRLDLRAEHRAQTQEHQRPDGPAQRVVGDEARGAHPHRTGHRRRDDRDAGHELGRHQRAAAPAQDQRLALAHAGIGRQRDAAQQPEHAMPMVPPGNEPCRIAQHVGDDRNRQQRRQRQRAADRQAAGHHQQRRGRQRHADARRQRGGEHDDQAVLDDEGDEGLHALRSARVAKPAFEHSARRRAGYAARPCPAPWPPPSTANC